MRNIGNFQVDYDNPFRRFKGVKSPKIPPRPDPVPTPQIVDEEAKQKDRDRRRQRFAAAGRGGTILTQGQSLSSGSATILGRSTNA